MQQKKKVRLLERPLVVCMCALFCNILWGSAFPCIKIGYGLFGIAAGDSAAQILFAGYRFILAGVFTVAFGSVLAGRALCPHKEAFGRVCWLALLQTVLQYLFFYIGLAHTTGVKASIIVSVNVFVAILVASLLFRQEKLTVRKLSGCAAGFAGVVIANLGGLDAGIHMQGEGLVFFSTVAYAFSSVYMKRFSRRDNPVMLSGWQFAVGGLVLMAAGLCMGGKIDTVSVPAVLLLIYLAFVSAAAYTLWGLLLKYNPVSKVAVYGFMNPVCGVLLSMLLLGERQHMSGIAVSLAFIGAGIYAVNRAQDNR